MKGIFLSIVLVVAVITASYAADYREATNTGQIKAWRRATNISITNPLGGVPSIVFYEEDKIRLPNGTIMSGPGVRDPQIKASLTQPLSEFPLINPDTGEIIGTARQQDIYVLLYSLYWDLATKRDASLFKSSDTYIGATGTNN